MATSNKSALRSGSLWPRWLNLREASRYSAIGEKRLIELAGDGTVRGFQDNDSGRRSWIFDRESLDAYREGQAAESPGCRMQFRVAEIMSSMRPRGKM